MLAKFRSGDNDVFESLASARYLRADSVAYNRAWGRKMIKNFLSISVCHKNTFQDINIFLFSNKYFVQNLTWYKQTCLFMDLLI